MENCFSNSLKTVKRRGGTSSTLRVSSSSTQGQRELAARSEGKFRAGIFIQMEQALESNRQGAVEFCFSPPRVPTMFEGRCDLKF